MRLPANASSSDTYRLDPSGGRGREAIRAYIARDSPHYAALLAERIVESVERLREFPRSGRVVPEMEREFYREVILSTYRIVYRLKGDRAEILTVVHATCLLPTLGGTGDS